ncbi:hypothetical protein KV097_17770 [Mumia sp. zg.B17]|uniref:YqeB family protein n=1 Tax=unclassified Mumia TaxID=2621872 RepID=UPI001C6F55B6|nr:MULTISPECIES: hypothetical protein [unclassified Mumia]MBW9207788.1 hypothetical protein [Mumia sp. zg.B17]MBW9209867.1 hypothetical protein [Mumia sp. zg.B21]
MTVEPPTTTLGYTRSDAIGTAVVFGVGGLLLFLLAPVLAAWLADVPVVPFKGPLEWVASFDQPWAWVARPTVGLLLGLALAASEIWGAYRLEVDDDAVVVHHGDDRRRIDRTQVVAVYRDGKKVVIDGHDGRRLFEQEVEASRKAVAAAFQRHGYPWEGL